MEHPFVELFKPAMQCASRAGAVAYLYQHPVLLSPYYTALLEGWAGTLPPDEQPAPPPSLNDNVAEATSAVTSLARRTADQTVNDGQLLVPSVTLPMPSEQGVEPPAESLREAGHGVATGLEFMRTELDDPKSRIGKLKTIPGSNLLMAADMIVKALGQEPLLDLLQSLPELKVDGTRVVVDRATGATNISKLYAGGDCIRGGGEIVDAVQDGKIAAWGIHAEFQKKTG